MVNLVNWTRQFFSKNQSKKIESKPWPFGKYLTIEPIDWVNTIYNVN